jgi:KaiC/GvpD/RAD55 family RecA-like ATPase
MCDAPPSVKPDKGEPIKFAQYELPLPVVPAPDLCRAAAELATASYLLRYYPNKGERHDYSRHAAGALYHSGWSRESALEVIRAAAKAAGDDEDRSANVHSAFNNGEKDAKVTGWPCLEGWLGDDLSPAQGVSLQAADHAKPDKPETPHDIDYVARLIKGSDWDTLEFPPRVELVKGVIWERSLNMVFGDTGIGKSWFALELALCIAQGRDFLAWETAVDKRPTVYIDGELMPDQLQERIRSLAPKRPDRFLTYSVLQYAALGEPDFNLCAPGIQRAVEQMVAAHNPALIVFDNLTKLVKGFDKNAGDQWESILRWMDQLRATGPAILIVHHTNKSGDQTGSKVQEIGLETNIELKKTKDQAFRIGFKKTRNRPPKPPGLQVEIHFENGIATLEPVEFTPEADDTTRKTYIRLADGWKGSLRKLADAVGTSKSTADRIVRKARANGHLAAKGWGLTTAGKERAEQLGSNSGEL